VSKQVGISGTLEPMKRKV